MADEETPQDAPEASPEQGSAFFPPQDAPEGEPPPAEGELAPDAAPAEEPAQDPLERSYEDLARRDRELQDRLANARELEQQARQWQAIQQQAQQDPGAVLHQLGINPYTLPDKLLGIEPEEPQGQQQIPKDMLTRAEAQQMFQEQLAHQQQVMQQQQGIAQMIQGSDHELIRDRAQRDPRFVGEIFEEATQRYRDHGTLPDIPAILREREEREQANIYASLDRVLQLGNVREYVESKLRSGNETPQAPKKTPPAGAPQQTLSQQHKEEPHQEERPMTDEERWAEFANALKHGAPEGHNDKL